MRLAHLGFKSFFLLDTNVPQVNKGDCLIIGSGSGNTVSVAEMAELAAKKEVSILLITANMHSRISSIATSTIELNAQTKANENDRPHSIQPMTTLFEQSLLLTLDALVIELMKVTKQKNQDLEARHNILE
jgi:6-phospho-3-hexuloisomerase